ncbi:alpha/beta fold hydrolase [Peribacillus alkalitolerans]|uniref:alpha/beta fold hydrolase n=1 Tax=Peribacillus alkalitolerans TaxID=1550385 RepID=UPI0013D51A15|nr:alpha/beta hydrolase [Peribacillus alkalitolerans]
MTIYINEAGKKRLQDHYESYLKTLNVPFERKYIDTRFGKTHVLVTGPKEGKPLLILQGGNCINPMTVSWFSSLLGEYRVYAPDTIGHPGYSTETRVSAQDDSFANWIVDLMNHFQIEKAAFAGASFGGGIILRLASYFPERIASAILFAPAGIILGSKVEMIKKILVPLLILKFNGSQKQLVKIAEVMSDGYMKNIDAEITGEVFRSVKLEQDMPKLVKEKELQNFKAPTMIIGGEKDIFFPGEKLIHRANQIIPNLVESKLYGSGHFSSEMVLEQVNRDMVSFLKKYY